MRAAVGGRTLDTTTMTMIKPKAPSLRTVQTRQPQTFTLTTRILSLAFSPTPDRRVQLFIHQHITSHDSSWNKAEQSTRWHLSSLCQSRPHQLVQLPTWSLRLPQPLTPMSLASCSRRRTSRVCATMLNTATTTRCSSCSPGAHGLNTKVCFFL